MRLRQSSLAHTRIVFLVIAVLILTGNTFAAVTEKVLYSFLGSPDAISPTGDLVADPAGNLYGMTYRGGHGSCDCGAIYELSPPTTAGDAWTETVLYSFKGGASDGEYPLGGLILDKSGNLYGAANMGGLDGFGTIFELSPPTIPGGNWTETILWAFDYTRGGFPAGNLVMDVDGNLYGTTQKGGVLLRVDRPGGVAFELVAPKTSGGAWSERILHRFGTARNDGIHPSAGLLLRDGVLYGTTVFGGTNGQGTVFQLVRQPGRWTETILHNFTGGDGKNPAAALIADTAGNLYGAAEGGGGTACGCGVIYELSPPSVAGNPWQEATLYTFTAHGDGELPVAALLRDSLGNLYGTSSSGHNNGGAVFKLKPPAVSGGVWTFVFLHDFKVAGDGGDAISALTRFNGILYGATAGGGAGFGGTVYSIVP